VFTAAIETESVTTESGTSNNKETGGEGEGSEMIAKDNGNIAETVSQITSSSTVVEVEGNGPVAAASSAPAANVAE
jgi:hypothetical protein